MIHKEIVMKKQKAIIEFLSFIVLSGIILSGFSLIENVLGFVDFLKQSNGISFCQEENGCDYLIGILVAILIFVMQVYLGFLFKKEKKEFPIYFIGILFINLVLEGSFFLIESINVSSLRIVFGIFYLVIFSFYLFGTKDAKEMFSN